MVRSVEALIRHPLPACAASTAASMRTRLAYGARVARLAAIGRWLAAINGRLAHSPVDERSAVLLDSLRRIASRVPREIANPADGHGVGPEARARYLASLERLIGEYAATEALLDGATLAQLDWVTQQIRLEYLRFRIAAPVDEAEVPDSQARTPHAKPFLLIPAGHSAVAGL